MKDKFACYAACPAGEAEDPTQLTSQWVTTTTEGQRWTKEESSPPPSPPTHSHGVFMVQLF
eukprot:2015871-Amphidinium_carterae.1